MFGAEKHYLLKYYRVSIHAILYFISRPAPVGYRGMRPARISDTLCPYKVLGLALQLQNPMLQVATPSLQFDLC